MPSEDACWLENGCWLCSIASALLKRRRRYANAFIFALPINLCTVICLLRTNSLRLRESYLKGKQLSMPMASRGYILLIFPGCCSDVLRVCRSVSPNWLAPSLLSYYAIAAYAEMTRFTNGIYYVRFVRLGCTERCKFGVVF